MADKFSAEWMAKFKEEWNNEPDLAGALEKIGFNSVIAYGFLGDDAPLGYISVENGQVTDAGAYEGQEVNWDLRASDDNWSKWMAKGIGMMGLGAAYTTGKIKFLTGDYSAMIKDPRMAGPFIKSFSVMGRV
ncbi:MAG: SCP-2 sterol transfer family protein [Gammaproteobacteria bacterium]